MNKQNNKRTLRQEISYVLRAVGIWNKLIPRFWFWHVVCIFVSTFTPYFDLYMSSLFINELAGACELRRLAFLAAVSVGGNFVISIISRFLQSRKNMKDIHTWQHHQSFFFEEQNKMQYEHLEDPEVVLLSSKISTTAAAVAGGLVKVKWAIPKLLECSFNIIFSVSLTVSLFTMKSSGEFGGIFAFINSPASAILLIAIILLNTVITIKMSAYTNSQEYSLGSELGKINATSHAYKKVWGADVIMFGLTKAKLEEIRKRLLRPDWVIKREKYQMKFGVLSVIIGTVLNVMIYLFIGAKAFIGVFGIGNFILYQGTVSRFVGAVSSLAGELGQLKQNNLYLDDVYTFIDMPNNMYKGSLAVEKRDDIDYEIEFRDVSFKYPRTENWALRHVSIKFKIGDKLAIVGENGSGKSTFIKLLCRLYDPTEGKILLNGIDISRYRYDEYIALFSVVFQDYTLFGFSLGDNVAADCTYDSERVRDCLARAGLGEKLADIENDPNAKEKDPLKLGVGRDYTNEGIDFSGGEKQKIALARALYKDAPFVILDEPTAALDPIAEAEVYENFNTLVEDKTSVFISHRLSSCRFCDRIAVFDGGELVQRGSHDELVSVENGKYHELWYAQAQYYVVG